MSLFSKHGILKMSLMVNSKILQFKETWRDSVEGQIIGAENQLTAPFKNIENLESAKIFRQEATLD